MIHPVNETEWVVQPWDFCVRYQTTEALGHAAGILVEAVGDSSSVLQYGLSSCIETLQKGDLIEILLQYGQPTTGLKADLLSRVNECVYGQDATEGRRKSVTRTTHRERASNHMKARPLLADAMLCMKDADATLANDFPEIKEVATITEHRARESPSKRARSYAE